MKAINLLKKVISCTPDRLSNTQRLTMSGLIFALDFKTFGGQTSRLKISGLSGVSISATHRNMSQFIKLGLVSQQRRTKTIKTAQGDERREIEPYIKINIEALIKYIEHSHSETEHSHSETEHSHSETEHSHSENTHSHDDNEHSHSENVHSHGETEHSHGDIPYTALYTDYNNDYNTVKNTVNTHVRARRKPHALAWGDLFDERKGDDND